MIEDWENMTDAERRDCLWGLRNGCASHMNRIRKEGSESVKAAITERDLPASVTRPPAPNNIIALHPEMHLEPDFIGFASQ